MGGAKTYRIPCSWEMYGYYEVDADTLEEAIQMAVDGALPEGDYVDASFEVDKEICENDYPNESINWDNIK